VEHLEKYIKVSTLNIMLIIYLIGTFLKTGEEVAIKLVSVSLKKRVMK